MPLVLGCYEMPFSMQQPAQALFKKQTNKQKSKQRNNWTHLSCDLRSWCWFVSGPRMVRTVLIIFSKIYTSTMLL